jgi:hypothetical protein
MKRFYIQAPAGADMEKWLDSGFAAFAAGAGEDVRPKVVVIYGEAALPDDLAEDYRGHTWRGFTILTRLEVRLAAPDWGDYADEAKAVAGAVYRHLLAEVFRETREWCGHTFSVLGR